MFIISVSLSIPNFAAAWIQINDIPSEFKPYLSASYIVDLLLFLKRNTDMPSKLSSYLYAFSLVRGILAHGKIYFFAADGVKWVRIQLTRNSASRTNTTNSYTGLLNNDSLPSAAWTNTNGANFIGFVEGVPSAPTAPVAWSLQTDDVSSWHLYCSKSQPILQFHIRCMVEVKFRIRKTPDSSFDQERTQII